LTRSTPCEDKDARWTKKYGKSYFGYKNHVNVDKTHELIRRYAVTDAAEHDSRQLDGLTSQDVFGDSAYRSAAAEVRLKARGFRSRIHVRARRGHPLSKTKAAANRTKSRIRARIEHVFGAQETAPGGRFVRTIGIVRRASKSACRTSPTTSAGWRHSNEWPPHERPPKRPIGGETDKPSSAAAQRSMTADPAPDRLIAAQKNRIVRGSLQTCAIEAIRFRSPS
jgi:Transposase DDE domain